MGEAADDVHDAGEAFARILEECDHADADLDILTMRARCPVCGHIWYPTPEQAAWMRGDLEMP